MKHVKIMNLPECDKLVYCSGTIGRQVFATISNSPRKYYQYKRGIQFGYPVLFDRGTVLLL